MANLIPQIGATGVYKLIAPFDSQLREGIPYTCVAVRRLNDFITNGRDPKSLYYDPYELPDSIWERDYLDPDTCIVSLTNKSGQWIYVPSTFIVSYPDIGGIPYTVRILGINLGAIPDTLDLSNLITNVQNLVKDTVGIESVAKTVAASETKIISKEDADAIESAREDLITIEKTDRARIMELEALVQSQRTQIEALQDYIESELEPSP